MIGRYARIAHARFVLARVRSLCILRRRNRLFEHVFEKVTIVTRPYEESDTISAISNG